MRKIKITIAELEKKTGTKRSTIHHYIRSGVLHAPDKTSQTMAYYDESHLAQLEKIRQIKAEFLKDAKTTRVPLDFIKDRLREFGAKNVAQAAAPEQEPPAIEASGSRKKRQIIKEALALYAINGYRKTTIRDICRKAGVSTPSFYHYFPDKRELFVEVTDYVIDEWRNETVETLQNTRNPIEKGVLQFEIFQKHHPRIAEILDYLSTEAGSGDAWAADRLKKMFARLMKNVLYSTRVAIQKGVMRDTDPELMAYFFIKINEAATQRLALDDKYSAQEMLTFVGDLIGFGLLSPESQHRLAEKREADDLL